jgi:hypothetical protein
MTRRERDALIFWLGSWASKDAKLYDLLSAFIYRKKCLSGQDLHKLLAIKEDALVYLADLELDKSLDDLDREDEIASFLAYSISMTYKLMDWYNWWPKVTLFEDSFEVPTKV